MVAETLTYRFAKPSDAALMAGEHDLRFRVLRAPLGYTRADVRFDFDDESVHLLALQDDTVVGCVLFHPESPADGRLYQMAVAPDLQGRGVGRELVRRLESRLRDLGVTRVHLHARQAAVGFYRRLGYAVEGEPFDEVGVPHRHMARAL